MTYDVIYQKRGDKVMGRVFITVGTEEEARRVCKRLENFPEDTINIGIIREEDGKEVYNFDKDGLIV